MRGQPGIACYSAAKGALERWAESMAGEIAPFGLGVTVLIAGTYDTDIITDAGTTDDRDFDGPYARMHRTIDKRGRFAIGSLARPPEKFTDGLAQAPLTTPLRFAAAVSASTRRCCWRPTDFCRPPACTR